MLPSYLYEGFFVISTVAKRGKNGLYNLHSPYNELLLKKLLYLHPKMSG
ncbi:MAG: hypothetical protein JWP81_1430 [Ferruginibacter sp.]|nr:hypothetical protein [Ferruginibacter sp.]